MTVNPRTRDVVVHHKEGGGLFVKRCVRGWTVLREELHTFVIVVRLVRAVVVGELLEVAGGSRAGVQPRHLMAAHHQTSLGNASVARPMRPRSRSRAVLARFVKGSSGRSD